MGNSSRRGGGHAPPRLLRIRGALGTTYGEAGDRLSGPEAPVAGRRLGKGLAVVVGLLMLEGGKASDDGTKAYYRLIWHIW